LTITGTNAANPRLSTGIAGLDDRLGGGLLPGTLTVVIGPSGVGKTQLGLHSANAGLSQEGKRGILFDMNARVDPQSHAEYAQRMFDWRLASVDPGRASNLANYFAVGRSRGDYLHIFDLSGRRVTLHEAGFDAWHDWQTELSTKLTQTIDFFYGNFVAGVRRCVVDGFEPADRQHESIQFELFEYIYHQVLRKDADWVARDLFREHYRANATAAAAHAYEYCDVACMMLYTSHESMLDALIERPLQDSDLFVGANTVIYLGKIRDGRKLRRALYVAKHRGSDCSEEIATYSISDAGLSVDNDGASP
jgi:KaiC/GvpD/RAD55 family RecA-like ATPase